MITHCCSEEVAAYTPSDFSATELSPDELDDLVAELSDAGNRG